MHTTPERLPSNTMQAAEVAAALGITIEYTPAGYVLAAHGAPMSRGFATQSEADQYLEQCARTLTTSIYFREEVNKEHG